MNLEIKVMSCKDVKSFNFFQKLQVYAVVSITTSNNEIHPEKGRITDLSAVERQEQRTLVDNEAEGGNPEWNHTMRFNLAFLNNEKFSIKRLFLHFQLRHKNQLFFGDKVIGNVYAPFNDLIPHHHYVDTAAASTDRTGIVRYVDYQVKSPEKKPNGVIRFSYKVFGVLNDSNHHQIANAAVDITGYTLPQPIHHNQNQDQNKAQGFDEEPGKIQHPTVYPQPYYTPSANLVNPSVRRPPQPATEEYKHTGNFYFYDIDHRLTDSIVDNSGCPLPQPIYQDQNQVQGLDMEPGKIQYPTIYPLPECTTSKNLAHPSVRPPQSATEEYKHEVFNYSYYYTNREFHDSNSIPPHYPPGSGPPPPQTPRPLSMWDPPL